MTNITSFVLTWNQIKESFSGLWVELIDFEWDWSSAHPRRARVRNFADDRNALLAKIQEQGRNSDSVILYVGSTVPFLRTNHDSASI